jgi:hypothetical protein
MQSILPKDKYMIVVLPCHLGKQILISYRNIKDLKFKQLESDLIKQ